MNCRCSAKKMGRKRLKRMKSLCIFSKPASMRRQKIIAKTLKIPFITMRKELEMKNLAI